LTHTLRKVDAVGTITTVAGGGFPVDGLGDGGPATSARLSAPSGVAVDPAGSLFIADTRNSRIRKVDTVGHKFDPNLHQALFEVPTKDHPPGTVVQEMQSGFAIGDRCLRPAMVGVAKAEG